MLAPPSIAAPAGDIRLVLVVVIDQLAQNSLEANVAALSANGFRRILAHGVVYRRAYMSFAPTSTAPGHATLATGALPPVHGVPANVWYDRKSGDKAYCTADSEYKVLGRSSRWDDGTSPARLQAEAFADVIAAAGAGQTRVFAIAGKDRSAILMAGHQGKAIWYDRYQKAFTTSDFYFADLPRWLADFNTRDMADLDGIDWVLSRPPGGYRFRNADDQPWEHDYKGLGRTFPHDLRDVSDVGAAFRFLPQLDEKTLDLAMRVVEAECLGCGPKTDVLVLGLSATDYVGHAYGPDSLEWEDNLYRLDARLDRLLAWIDRQVGLAHVLIALSSDHGIASAPEYLIRQGIPAGRVDVPGLVIGLRAHLKRRFGLHDDPVLGVRAPSVYLNSQVFVAAGIDSSAAEYETARYLARVPGIAVALTRGDLLAGRVAGDVESQRIAAGFHPEISGDVLLVQERYWYLDKDPGQYATTHGSPYDYDAHVPMMFMGPGISAQTVDRQVGTEDFAPTILGYLGLPPPSETGGRVLPELAVPSGAGTYNSDKSGSPAN